jgi:hypothetical protein
MIGVFMSILLLCGFETGILWVLIIGISPLAWDMTLIIETPSRKL